VLGLPSPESLKVEPDWIPVEPDWMPDDWIPEEPMLLVCARPVWLVPGRPEVVTNMPVPGASDTPDPVIWLDWLMLPAWLTLLDLLVWLTPDWPVVPVVAPLLPKWTPGASVNSPFCMSVPTLVCWMLVSGTCPTAPWLMCDACPAASIADSRPAPSNSGSSGSLLLKLLLTHQRLDAEEYGADNTSGSPQAAGWYSFTSPFGIPRVQTQFLDSRLESAEGRQGQLGITHLHK
jgi:hypothetical protein